ncbi:acetyltransferase [uncultured Dokdonia sp.]|uniref:acetyltransferase n=1 Tax=uncultured Dokdonia sp. TaxID=575653 RepID=UPI0030EBF930|tara:strand:+ start:44637 stop:45296 length:660 start_codon:yes stop_codon:yes gene_type:complete
MAEIVIFGTNDLAELAHYYLTSDSKHNVVAFTVHSKYREVNTYKGLPVVDFENLESLYPTSKFSLFAPMIGTKMNSLRESVYNEGKNRGYTFISYVSSRATLFENKIGDNCFILENNTIQPFVEIGNNVILWSGNHIGHHSAIGDHVFITSQVVISGHCTIESNCFIGVNATVRDGCHLKKATLIAMGACFTKTSSVENGVYIGNPSKLKEGVESINVF